MARKKAFVLLVFVFTLLSVSAMAQSSVTPYQRKMAQVTLKYFNIFTYNPKKPKGTPMIEWLALTKNDPEAMGELVGMAALGYTQKHGAARTKQIMQRMSVEVKQANKLRTKADVQRERNQANAEEKAKQDKAWKETDRYKITEGVKQQLAAWCQKGEYEKAADVDERLKTQSEDKFDEICAGTMDKFEELYSSVGQRVMGNYDSENERFLLVFNFKGDQQYFFTQGIVGSCYYDVPIDDAEKFKDRFQTFDQWESAYRGGQYVILDWCFVNNMLVPKRLQLNLYPFGWTRPMDLTFHKYDVDGNIISDLVPDSATIFFDKLGIDNQYLKEYYYTECGDEEMQTLAEEDSIQSHDQTIYDAVYGKNNDKDIEKPSFLPRDKQYEAKSSFQDYFKAYFVFPKTWKEFKDNEKKDVVVSFVVEKDGSISNVQLETSADPSLDEAALNFVKGMPNWTPANKRINYERSYNLRFKEYMIFHFTYNEQTDNRSYIRSILNPKPKVLWVTYEFVPPVW